MTAEDFRDHWADPRERLTIVEALEQVMGREESDPFDLLCHLAFGAPLRTRKQRADDAKRQKGKAFATYGPGAQTILDQLLDQYAGDGINELSGGAKVFRVLPRLRQALGELPRLICA